MEKNGVNDFEDLDGTLQALMVMIDEAGELLSPSGVKALSENTLVPLSDGTRKLLRDIAEGDVILDNKGEPTTVIDKYEPERQVHYNMTISKDSTGESEQFIAGEEHFWVVYMANPDNSVDGPFLLETKELDEVMKEEKAKPEHMRKKLKIKKG